MHKQLLVLSRQLGTSRRSEPGTDTYASHTSHPVLLQLSNGSARERRYPDGSRFGAEARPMIDDEPLLALPLVHPLVQQWVQRLVPAVAADVAATQHDLRLAAFARRRIVAEPALHPP